MKVQFHTKDGIFDIDTDTITDEELAELDGMDRDKLNAFLAEQPRDLAAEIDAMAIKIKDLEDA